MVISTDIVSSELQNLFLESFGFPVTEVVTPFGEQVILDTEALITKLCGAETAQYKPKPWHVLVAEVKGSSASEAAQCIYEALRPKAPSLIELIECDRNLADLLAIVQEYEV